MGLLINYNYNSLDEARELSSLVEQKLRSLEKYLPDEEVVCDVEFNKLGSHQSGKLHQMAVNIKVKGRLYRAETTEEGFEKAIDVVKNELDVELRRAKGKQEDISKKDGRAAKEKMLKESE